MSPGGLPGTRLSLGGRQAPPRPASSPPRPPAGGPQGPPRGGHRARGPLCLARTCRGSPHVRLDSPARRPEGGRRGPHLRCCLGCVCTSAHAPKNTPECLACAPCAPARAPCCGGPASSPRPCRCLAPSSTVSPGSKDGLPGNSGPQDQRQPARSAPGQVDTRAVRAGLARPPGTWVCNLVAGTLVQSSGKFYCHGDGWAQGPVHLVKHRDPTRTACGLVPPAPAPAGGPLLGWERPRGSGLRGGDGPGPPSHLPPHALSLLAALDLPLLPGPSGRGEAGGGPQPQHPVSHPRAPGQGPAAALGSW